MPSELLRQRYKIQGEIAVTSQNIILLATDQHTGRQCVIKVANGSTCSAVRHCLGCETLVAEKQVLRTLAAATISAPRVVDCFHFDQRLHLVLRYISGATLQSLVDRKQLHARDALSALVQICDILIATHVCGYVHQDVKPANIILRPNGQAILIDWGSAESLERPMTQSYTFTMDYASPEQIVGEVNVGNDIFALGRTLATLVPYASVWVQHIISTATAPLHERYQSVRDFRFALRRLQWADRLIGSLGATMLRV